MRGRLAAAGHGGGTMGLRAQQGFTLIESMVVVAIIGILSVVSILAINSRMPRYRLNGATDQVAWDLIRARRSAIKEQRRTQVYFTSSHKYRICDDADRNGTVTNCEGNAVFKDLRPKFSDVTFSSNVNPVFLPRGTVGSGGTVTVTSPAGNKTITIQPTTGRIEVN